jgi:putative membrane protein
MVIFLLILALIVAVTAVIFALQNSAMVPVTFFIWQSSNKSLALLILAAVAIGFIIGLLAILPPSVRNRWRVSNLRKQVDGLKKSLLDVQAKLDQANLAITEMQQKPDSSIQAGEASNVDASSTPETPPQEPPIRT